MKFSNTLWQYPGPGSWHFITLPAPTVTELKEKYHPIKRGWGSIPVMATIGQTTWKTSIFPSKDIEYLLPVKAEVRRTEKLSENDMVAVSLKVLE